MSASRGKWRRVDAGIYRRGESYLIDFYSNGRRHYLRLGAISLTSARRIAAELRGEIARCVAGLPPVAEHVTVKQVLDTRIAERKLNVASSTWRRLNEHAVHLVRHLGRIDARTLCLMDIRSYQDRRIEEGAEPGTVNRETTVLHSSVRLAVRDQKLERDVMDGIEKLPEPEPGSRAKVLGDSEFALIQKCATPWFRRFVVVAAEIGCRAGELATIRVDDFDSAHGTITFRCETVKGRRGKRRTRMIPLPASALEALREQMAEALTVGSEYLFFARKSTSRPVQVDQLNQAWRRVRKAAGVTGRLHDLRHTLISKLIKNGTDASIVRRIVGHSSTQMIDSRYAHLDIDDLAFALTGRVSGKKESHTVPTRPENGDGKQGSKAVH